jgi:hypothetical protein
MPPEQITLKQALAEERARLWMQVRNDIAALRHLVNQSQQLMDDARPRADERGAPSYRSRQHPAQGRPG